MNVRQPARATGSNGGRNHERSLRREMSASLASRPRLVSEYPAKRLAQARIAVRSVILSLAVDPAGELVPDGQPRPQVVVPAEPDEQAIAEAVVLARDSDVVVVAVVGDRIELVGEGRSTATLELVGGQVALLDALAATGTPLVVVLMASKPLVLPPSAPGGRARRLRAAGRPVVPRPGPAAGAVHRDGVGPPDVGPPDASGRCEAAIAAA